MLRWGAYRWLAHTPTAGIASLQEFTSRMISSSTKACAPSKTKFVLTLLMHEFIGTIGAILLAATLTAVVLDFPNPWGRTITRNDLFHAVTGFAPYFPVQIAVALLLGWMLSDLIGHQSMSWIWVPPYAWLVLAFARLPDVAALSFQLRLSYFFGLGCRLEDYCIDQLVVTLPFYTSLAYSIGALLQHKIRLRSPANRRKVSTFVIAIGVIVLGDMLRTLIVDRTYFSGLRPRWAVWTALVLLLAVGGCPMLIGLRIRGISWDAAESQGPSSETES